MILELISKTYDKNLVIREVSLSVKDREFLVLVGPSGCGKSTLLRMIAGLEEITGGVLRIDGRVVNQVPPKDRDIAMVFQNYALYPHMSVFDNMAFGLKMRKTPKPEILAKVAEAARILDLESVLQRKPKQLSGGQRQRVALGRAIVRNPKVFLMDEPLSNLDAKLRVQMRSEIAALHKRLNATTIYVTHDQVEAMTMGDRIVILNKGDIQQVDTPLNVYHDPANMFVAGFVGQMNFLNGVVEEANGLLQLRLSNGDPLPLPETLVNAGRSALGKPVVLGLRPEAVLPADTPEALATAAHSLTLSPVRIEMLGSEQMVHCTVAGQSLIARWPSEIATQEGTPVDMALDLTRAYLFDAVTEARLR